MDFLQALERKGVLEQISRIRRSCKEIYDLAWVNGRAINNPLEGLKRLLQSKAAEYYAHVTAKELPDLLRAISAYPHAADLHRPASADAHGRATERASGSPLVRVRPRQCALKHPRRTPEELSGKMRAVALNYLSTSFGTEQ